MSLLDFVTQLLGFSAYQPPPIDKGRSLDDPEVVRARAAAGGGLVPLPQTKLRWYDKELETAQQRADMGDMSLAGQLYRAMRRSGTLSGLLETRTSGLLRLPRTFKGDETTVRMLTAASTLPEGEEPDTTRQVFDETFPAAELKLLAQDGIMLGVGVGELVPVPGRLHPRLVRLEPEFLTYRWNENRWYYRSIAGLLPITPGDGRWILHLPGGRMSPWQFGKWIPCGDAWITLSHAGMHRKNYGGKLANPARVAYAPAGATEPQREGMISRLMAWGLNTCFEMPAGWDAKLLESNGRGHDVWKADIADAKDEIKMALAGQVVTSDGGTGFDKGDLFKNIRADLVQTDGNELAETINTQGMPALTLALNGGKESALANVVSLAWDTTPPQDRQREATMIQTAAASIKALQDAARPIGYEVDGAELVRRLRLPLRKAAKEATPVAKLEVAPTDVFKVTRVDEIRASQGLPGIGDERGQLTGAELDAKAAAPAPAVGQPVAPAVPSNSDATPS